MILETSWGTPTGWIVVRDLLTMGPWHHEDGQLSHTHRRAPADYDAEHVLLRTVRCVNREVQLVLECEGDGVDVELALTTDMRLGFETDGLGRACHR